MKKWTAAALALIVIVFASSCACAQSYRYGDYADEISVIQEALEELDLYYAEITGHYGRKTERAVKLFQKKYGLAQTGIADEATIKKLYQKAGVDDVPEGGEYIGPSSDPAGMYSAVLRRNSSGNAVRKLQEDLHDLDFYDGVISGSYGGLTQEAVRQFQKKYGLDADGIAGPRTLMKIAELLAERDGEALPDTGAALKPVQKGSAFILRQGMKGDAVERLQRDLDELGFYKGSITGSYGSLTKEAVRKFQRKYGLSSDGIAGPVTLARIEQELLDEDGEAEEDEEKEEERADDEDADDEEAKEPSISLEDVSLLNTNVTLRRSSRSGYVTRLQQALTALGYFTHKCDGYFGGDTEAAVILYQKARGLTADGIAGRATLSSINRDIEDGVTAADTMVD